VVSQSTRLHLVLTETAKLKGVPPYALHLTRAENTYIITVSRICLREMAVRKTTLVIDEELLDAAMKAVGARTKKEAVEAGLKSLVQDRNREALRKGLGTFEIDLTLEELDRLRHAT
jgi:Arc/MetJ family transcription regulator